MNKLRTLTLLALTAYSILFTYNRFDLYTIPYEYGTYIKGSKVNYIKQHEVGFNRYPFDGREVIIDGDKYGTYLSCNHQFKVMSQAILCDGVFATKAELEDVKLDAGTYIYDGSEYIKINKNDVIGVIKDDKIINRH